MSALIGTSKRHEYMLSGLVSRDTALWSRESKKNIQSTTSGKGSMHKLHSASIAKFATKLLTPLFLLLLTIGQGLADEETVVSVLSEIQVSTYEIPDPEYDQDSGQFTFSDKAGNLWIGNVDPITGDFDPLDGHAILVDTGAAFVTDFGNGPEWMKSIEGLEIVYTKYLPGKPLTGPICRDCEGQDDNKWRLGRRIHAT